MDRFILLKQYDRLLHLFLVCFLLLVVLSIPGCGAHTENGGSGDKTDISSTPTNTPAPDTNYLSVRVNGSLYGGAKPATSNEVNEDNYLGEVTSSITPSLLPKNDFESNCFKAVNILNEILAEVAPLARLTASSSKLERFAL